MSSLAAIVIRCRDPYVAGPFWATALGVPPVEEDRAKLAARGLEPGESILLRDPAGVRADVWVTPLPDGGPAAPHDALVHLDLQLDDQAELDALLAAGAVVRSTVEGERPWTVLASPDGIVFCARHHVSDSHPPATAPG